jgi:ABC-type transport system substrate-binding protein
MGGAGMSDSNNKSGLITRRTAFGGMAATARVAATPGFGLRAWAQGDAAALPAPEKLTVALATFAGEKFYPPSHNSEATKGMAGRMYDYLLEWEGAQLKPRIAESREVADDGNSWAFHVRKGVKFHNGDDLAGKDVAWSIERYLQPDVVLHGVTRGMIDHVELVDDYTVSSCSKASGAKP